ncbi:MAG: NAD(P)-dependent glycerol-3-phosphate dehydrogenase [Deltaproteobacteria bacterium]|nr:NAD(P)-dependent glycerol-3-phosphate dehydrogenase [Deltaproteobacteria bacterium]
MSENNGNLKIGVVGGGSWGTALANLLAQQGWPIDLWVFEEEVKLQIRDNHENKVFLPGIHLSENLRPSNDLGKVVADKDFLLTVVPSHLVREMAGAIATHISPETVVVSASKGIENGTHLTMTGVLREMLPAASADRISVLSGPSFAREVAVNVPTVVTVAATEPEIARRVQHIFATPYFRVYTSDDPMGVELGGAVKNVIAIAAGIVDGLGLGLNTRAALITRGQTEIRRLGLVMGANPRTFTGLAGIGDLILTCTGDLSRNHTVGKKIGQGQTLKQILAEMRMVAEGVKTSQSVYNLARERGVEMPISTEVYKVLYNDVPPKEAVFRLMTRDLKEELDEK